MTTSFKQSGLSRSESGSGRHSSGSIEEVQKDIAPGLQVHKLSGH